MTKREKIISCIQEGRGVLGIEFGSTRIKAVLIGPDQHRLDPGRTEFDPQYPAPLLNTGNDFFSFRHIRIRY